jgi:hypothetical protein
MESIRRELGSEIDRYRLVVSVCTEITVVLIDPPPANTRQFLCSKMKFVYVFLLFRAPLLKLCFVDRAHPAAMPILSMHHRAHSQQKA